MNKTVQLSTSYTEPERHNAQRYRLEDRWTGRRADDAMVPRADHTACSTIRFPDAAHILVVTLLQWATQTDI